MDPVHVHLVINHLPIVGSILGAIVLVYGLLARSIAAQNAAYLLFLLAALGGTVAYLTGEPSEEAIEHLPGISRELIEAHEDSAKIAFIATIVLAFTSLAGIGANLRFTRYQRTISYINVLMALISFGLLAYTGFQGGKIRHS